MREITLRPRTLTPSLARELEETRLVSFMRHPEDRIRASLKKDYLKGGDFPAGSHVFHSVTITYSEIFLASHPADQDEIVFNWDPSGRARPLYYVFARTKRDAYLSRLKSGTIGPSDYVALRAPMNDPRFSTFAIWQGTVHCECTRGGLANQPSPSFFVLEPMNLVVIRTEEAREGVNLVLGG